ncbi:MAG: hypothetical protein AAFY26_00755 [Cyanobacteria bacterium J06638_22]
MTSASVSSPQPKEQVGSTLYLAADLGKSNCKYLWSEGVKTHSLWLAPNVYQGASDQSLKKFEVGGAITETLWIRMGDRNTLIGGSAMGFQTSFAAPKVEIAALQIAGGMGAAAIQAGLTNYDAVIAATVPLNEFQYRNEIDSYLKQMAKDGILVRGVPHKFRLKTTFYPEGAGLYLLYRKMRNNHTPGRVIVLMLGHRNLSVLVFDDGELNPNQSQTSDRLGFWHSFKPQADTNGVREIDYSTLMDAITSGQYTQFSISRSKQLDYGTPANAVIQDYLENVGEFCKDHVLALTKDKPSNIVLGGGVAHVLRMELKAYFEAAGQHDNIFFADYFSNHLSALARNSDGAQKDGARTIRYADCYGIYQTVKPTGTSA